MWLFKVKLDPSDHQPKMPGFNIKKVGDIPKPGYFIAVKPTLDSSGSVHMLYTNDVNEVWYMTWNWSSQKAMSYKLY